MIRPRQPMIWLSFLLAMTMSSRPLFAQDGPPAPEPLDSGDRPGEVPPRADKEKGEPEDKGVRSSVELMKIELDTGEHLFGYVSEQKDTYAIELEDGTQLVLPQEAVVSIRSRREIEREEKIQASMGDVRDAHRVRYFISPSAFALEPGEGWVSHKDFVYTSFAVGVTRRVSAYGGMFLPAYLGGLAHIAAGAKVSLNPVDKLHVALGGGPLLVSELGRNDNFAFGLVMGTLTYGTPARHVSFNGGYPLDPAELFGFERPLFFTLSAYQRINKRVGVIWENWWVPFFDVDDREHLYGLACTSLSARLIGQKWNVDLGLGVIGVYDVDFGDFIPVPIPLIDIARNFGFAPSTPPP